MIIVIVDLSVHCFLDRSISYLIYKMSVNSEKWQLELTKAQADILKYIFCQQFFS